MANDTHTKGGPVMASLENIQPEPQNEQRQQSESVDQRYEGTRLGRSLDGKAAGCGVTDTTGIASAANTATTPLTTGGARSSGRPLFHLADLIFGKVLAITPEKIETILGVLGSRLGLVDAAVPVVSFYDDDEDERDNDEEDDDKPYTVTNGVAVLPISGTLIKKAYGLSALSGLESYQALSAAIDMCMDDGDVQGIVLDVDSPGGSVDGMFELADKIYGMRGTKPMTAVCNDQMCSAAYALGSCADQVYITRTGMIGSVGAFMLHVDQSGRDKQNGVKYTYIQAGDKKTEGNPHEPLSKDAKVTLQAEVDRIRDMFVTMVARNRNVTAQQVADTQAGVVFGPAGTPLFADKVGTLDDAVSDMRTKLGIAEDDMADDMEMVADAPISALLENQFFHHEILDGKTSLCADIRICQTGIEILNGRGGGAKLSESDRAGVYHHLAAHVKDAGHNPKPLNSEAEYDELRATFNEKPYWCVDVMSRSMLPDPGKLSNLAGANGAADIRLSAELSHELFGLQKSTFLSFRTFGSIENQSTESGKVKLLLAPYDGSASCNLGGFKEIYQRGCFSQGLNNDPRVLFMHDESKVIGRKSANTARFWEDAQGLWAEADAPDTTWANDMLESMRRGDIDQASAAFYILKQRWETRGGERFRIVEQAMLREGSVHSFAAYETTKSKVAATVEQPAVAAEVATNAPIEEPTQAINQAELEVLRMRLQLLSLS